MSDQEQNHDEQERGVLRIIREIKAGVLAPGSLSKSERQDCVAHLSAVESFKNVEIAEILKVHPRTISRDLTEIAEANSLKPDPNLASILAGKLLVNAEQAILNIRRAVRDQGVPASVKVEAHHKAFDILDRYLARLQSMGYLPSAAHRIEADVRHHTGDLNSLSDVQAELNHLEAAKQDPLIKQIESKPPSPSKELEGDKS